MSAVIQREFDILITLAGWTADEALEFLNSKAVCPGGVKVLPPNERPHALRPAVPHRPTPPATISPAA